MINELKWGIGIIILIGISTLITYCFIENEEIKNFLMNIATEMIGIFTTFRLIDKTIQERDKKEELNKVKVGFMQFKKFTEYVMMLHFNIYKCLSEVVPQNPPTKYQDLFNT
jgi:hypothetical protein